MDRKRYLVVIADDYGIGPETSRGILDLAERGLVTGTVLLVNSPFAAQEVNNWRRSGVPLEMGWHPCLTLDRPLLPPARVPSLVQPDGTFLPLGRFIRRLYQGAVRAAEIEAELHAQYQRFQDLVGRPPSVVNSHHHVQIFPPVGAILWNLLRRQASPPYVRRVRESWNALAAVPGARTKRWFLSELGKRDARLQERSGLRGNCWLAGVTDPPCVADSHFLTRWLPRLSGEVVELTCHPGFWDTTLLGRDATPHDGQLLRRVHEYDRLRHPSFRETCDKCGFTLTSPTDWLRSTTSGVADAA